MVSQDFFPTQLVIWKLHVWWIFPRKTFNRCNYRGKIYYCMTLSAKEKEFTSLRSSHRRCSIKKMFLKILQNSQKTTRVGVSFIKKLPQVCNFLKKRLPHRCFPVNFVKLLRIPFFQNSSRRLLLYLSMEAIKILSFAKVNFTIQKSFWKKILKP